MPSKFLQPKESSHRGQQSNFLSGGEKVSERGLLRPRSETEESEFLLGWQEWAFSLLFDEKDRPQTEQTGREGINNSKNQKTVKNNKELQKR